jgi:asparagine synthase (glutamine-hydrolysing)
MIPGPRTIYREIERLLPGQYLMFRDGKTSTHWYWQAHFEENHKRPFTELKEDFLTVLRKSVRTAADGVDAGAFLSGGTDSSTIAGFLGEVTGEPARTYSIGFEAKGYDEMEYARIAARHFGTRHHEYYVTPEDVVSAIPRIAAVHDQPFGNSSAVPTYYCAKLAKEDGVETMLGGDGGDELFGGNTRYAKQRLYSLYSDLPHAVRKAMIEPALFALPGSLEIFAKLQRYIRNASQEMPARYDNYNLVERLGATDIFTPEFLQTVDPARPRLQMAEAYQAAHAETLINRMLALDLRYTLADNDLPKVSRACELAGVKVRYPMLDDDLVAFSARLAPELKLKGTRLRYFFKQALRDFLPGEILGKTKHGFGLPFGPWLQTHKPLAQIALDSLSDLKARKIVRPQFIDELTSKHVQRHAGYFGTLVWVLMMLEQWFKEHRAVMNAQGDKGGESISAKRIYPDIVENARA